MKIRYGSNSLEREFEGSVNDLLADRNLLGALNAPTDVYATAGGEVLEGHEDVEGFDTVTLEKRGSKKA